MESLTLVLTFLAILALLFWHFHEKFKHTQNAYLSLKRRFEAMSQLDDLTAAVNDNTTQLGLLATAIGAIPAGVTAPDLAPVIEAVNAQNATIKDLIAQAQAKAPAAPTA
jgi:hypothetical protein